MTSTYPQSNLHFRLRPGPQRSAFRDSSVRHCLRSISISSPQGQRPRYASGSGHHLPLHGIAINEHQTHSVVVDLFTDNKITSHKPSPLTIVDELAMADPKPTNSKCQKQAPLTPSVTGPKRRRPHAAAAWAKIRPVVEHLYIDLDMTLRDVMERIDEEHGFRAT